MLDKYIYIFNFIIFLTSLYSIRKNDRTYNVVLSLIIGFFGILLGHIIYKALSNIHDEIFTIVFLSIVEFIEIILSINKMKFKSIILSVVTSMLITFMFLFGIQIEKQSWFKYEINEANNGISIVGFSDKYNIDNFEVDFYDINNYVEIPKFIIKNFRIYKVTEISEKAFFECEDIHEVELPDSIKIIGNYAFAECTRLKLINIPNELEKIGARAFFDTNISYDIDLKEDIKIYDYINNYIKYNDR